jgi:hypothetical protein
MSIFLSIFHSSMSDAFFRRSLFSGNLRTYGYNDANWISRNYLGYKQGHFLHEHFSRSETSNSSCYELPNTAMYNTE